MGQVCRVLLLIALCSTVSALICGDGMLDMAETCDDGNLRSGDGCSGACQIEVGCVCSTPMMMRSACDCGATSLIDPLWWILLATVFVACCCIILTFIYVGIRFMGPEPNDNPFDWGYPYPGWRGIPNTFTKETVAAEPLPVAPDAALRGHISDSSLLGNTSLSLVGNTSLILPPPVPVSDRSQFGAVRAPSFLSSPVREGVVPWEAASERHSFPTA